MSIKRLTTTLHRSIYNIFQSTPAGPLLLFLKIIFSHNIYQHIIYQCLPIITIMVLMEINENVPRDMLS